MWDFIFAIVLAAAAILVAFLMFLTGSAKGYTEGYCAALDGKVLNPTSCNVDERVVTIP